MPPRPPLTVPPLVRRAYRLARDNAVGLRLRLGELPDVVIIGGQKCGTSSLHAYLRQQPGLVSSYWKEVHYFDNNYHRGLRWYRACFPPVRGRRRAALNDDTAPPTVFEASPYYLFHPAVPARLAGTLPQARLIVMLRDPIERAYSHYWHEVRLGHERLPLAEALAAEPDRLAGEERKLLHHSSYYSYNHERYAYVERGKYAVQLERWFDHVSRDQILILKSEDFFADPRREVQRVLAFLGRDMMRDIDLTPKNVGRYAARIAPELRRRLADTFAPHNERLRKMTGGRVYW